MFINLYHVTERTFNFELVRIGDFEISSVFGKWAIRLYLCHLFLIQGYKGLVAGTLIQTAPVGRTFLCGITLKVRLLLRWNFPQQHWFSICCCLLAILAFLLVNLYQNIQISPKGKLNNFYPVLVIFSEPIKVFACLPQSYAIFRQTINEYPAKICAPCVAPFVIRLRLVKSPLWPYYS